jgi:hypothetical protein
VPTDKYLLRGNSAPKVKFASKGSINPGRFIVRIVLLEESDVCAQVIVTTNNESAVRIDLIIK